MKLLLAYRSGRIAGRIAGIINHRYNSCLCEKTARFCWLDFVDDKEVSKALLSAIEQWAISKGMDHIMGVIGFQIAIPSLSKAFQEARGKMFPFGFMHIARGV